MDQNLAIFITALALPTACRQKLSRLAKPWRSKERWRKLREGMLEFFASFLGQVENPDQGIRAKNEEALRSIRDSDESVRISSELKELIKE